MYEDIPDLEDIQPQDNVAKPNVKLCTSQKAPDQSYLQPRVHSENKLEECTKSLFKKALTRKSLSVRNNEHKNLSSQKPSTIKMDGDQLPVQNPSWLTTDLLQKIGSNPKLAQWLNSPGKMALLSALGDRPEEYLKRGGTSEDMEVIRDIVAILGEHFTKLAEEAEEAEREQQKVTKPKKPLIEEIETPEERRLKQQVEDALADEKVREALQDKSVKQIIQYLSTDPDRGQRLAADASRDVKEKLRLLVEVGVLGVQTS